MVELVIEIGGRKFEVACQEGEEDFLLSAAEMLDEEAKVLADQIGRMPEARMLLMAGLMLADKTSAMEERAHDAEAMLAERDAELAELRNAPAPDPERIEVPVVPQSLTETLAEVAARAEAIAAAVEEKA